jgi:DNA-binding beta-propeller fold protein YncE
MKLRTILTCAAAAIVTACLAAGCGSSSATNTVTVTVTSSVGNAIIVGQSTTLTATVTGGTSTNTAVNWQPCQFTTTTVSGTTTTTSTAANCPTDGTLGTLSNQQTTGTATYTAPIKIPDQTKYPNLQIVITAQSQQDTTKTGSVKLVLDSGIGVTLTPTTATVATKELQQFNAVLANDLQSQGVTWLVTQSTPTSTITVPNLATCSPNCGTIDSSGVYTAPATIPTAAAPAGASNLSTTPANVSVVAIAKADNTRFASGTITIIQGGPITFNGISPTIAPQGAALWDIYLDAVNISSGSIITLTDQNGGTKSFTSATGQVKVIFPIPNSTTANPPSSGARLRLLESDLGVVNTGNTATPITYTVSVTDPAEPVTPTAGGQFTLTLMPVRPTIVASSPTGVLQGAAPNVSIDGGYFGPHGTFAPVTFQGNTVSQNPSSNSRFLAALFPSNAADAPGLYPLSVSRTTPPVPNPDNPAVTTVAVFPDYSAGPPATPPQAAAIAAGTNPSAIDIDPVLGVVAVAEAGPGSNAVQFYTIGSGTLSPLGGPVAVGQIPTGVSVNRTNHSVAVVNYGSQSVSILPIPVPGASTVTPGTVDLSGLLQGQVSPSPLPYAIGVDPDTNLALVAYSSTSTSSAANLGFVVNLNEGANPPFGCINDTATTKHDGPCVFAQVTLNTGAYPQIAVAPHGHTAYVSPGGSGIVSAIDVTKPSTSIGLSTLTLTAGTVTATTASGSTLAGLVPGIPSTVLITGVPAPNTSGNPTGVNFNGVFTVSVSSSTTFTYFLGSNITGSGTANGGTVFFGSPNVIFGGVSSTTQGIAINPITHTAALADADATGIGSASQAGPQIDILNQLDQSVSSISFFSGCTAFTVGCTNAPELLHTANVAWQPYTNSIVSYNPDLQHPCAANPALVCNGTVSLSDPVTQKRYAIVPVNGPSSATLPVQNGTTGSLRLWGGIAVDPATNQAFVVESGSTTAGSTNPGQIEIINLGAPGISPTTAFKSTEITEIVVPSPNPGPGIIGGIPGASVPQAALTSTTDLAGVQIFGSGFASAAQVFLDNTLLPSANVAVDPSGRLITVKIPFSFLSLPHKFALKVVSGGVESNSADFFVVKSVDMTVACASPIPSSVAIADQLKNGPFSPIAVVSNSGCNNISTIDINPSSATFGSVLHTISIGAGPQGIAVSSHLGMAVVANNGGGTASIVNLMTNAEAVPDVSTGTGPIGVAINESTGVALVANFGSNTVSQINLGLLLGSSPATSLTATSIGGVQEPIAVAIDPDRGTNNQGLAVVTGLQLISGNAPVGALYPVDIGLASPALSTTISLGSVTSTPTGIVFNPAVATASNPGLFYVNSSGGNVISSFNPDTGGSSQTRVGINPTALAVNAQSGAILTSNFGGKSVSIVDTVSQVKTVQTLGLPGSAQFGVAIDQFTNLAVIVDQAHNRVLIFPMPN